MTLYDKDMNTFSIEGDYTKKHQLTNLKFSSGVTCEQAPGTTLTPKNKSEKKENFSTFSFENIRYNGKPFRTTNCTQDYLDNELWMNNSEYDMSAGMKKNAYVIILLDSSKSFGSQFVNAKNMILDIVHEITK